MKKFFLFSLLLVTSSYHLIQAQNNNCLYFDGKEDYVEANSPLNGNHDFTVEMWFRSESNYSTSCNSNFSNFNWIISWDDNQFGIGDCAGDLRVSYKPLCPTMQGMCTSLPTVTINDGNWHHVAFAKSSLSIHLYLDGAYLTNFSGGTYNLDGFFRLGKSGTGSLGNDWLGSVDDLRIWNYKRSEAEVQETLNCELEGNEDGLVLYYDFNQGVPYGNNTSETTLFDRTSNGNDGTLFNFGLMGDISNYVPSEADINNPCQACEAVFEYIPNDCGEVRFINQSSSSSTNPSYLWDFGDGQTSTTTDPIHQYIANGNYQVCLTITDGSCSDQICNALSITVDNDPPIIFCAQPINAYPTDPGECTSQVTLGTTATDNCKFSLTCARSDGLNCNAPFPVGTTTVFYSAVDEAGNTDNCSITITVEDQEDPIPNCIDQSITAPPGVDSVIVDYPLPDFVDNCGVESTVCTPISGSKFPCGRTQVVCIITDQSGNQAECAFWVEVICTQVPNNYCDSAEIICRDEIDVLFIMDNSGSIQPNEFNAMVSITQNAISDIDAIYPNAQYAVAHYGGNFGDKVFIEHDFTNAGTASAINRQGAGGLSGGGPLGGVGDDFHASLDAIIDALNGVGNTNTQIVSSLKDLNKRSSSSFYVLYFTDGNAGVSPLTSPSGSAIKGTAILPYRNVNILKSSPFNGKFTVVHLEPFSQSIAVDQACAAIASPGGIYSGSIDIDTDGLNPDPTTIPRQYIKTDFNATSIDILSSLPPCDTVLSDFPCDSLMVMHRDLNTDSCCYAIDLKNNIGPDISCVEAIIISDGWIFNTGSISAGTGYAWACPPNNKKLCLTYPGGIPSGINTDALRYCFAADTSAAAIPQVVVFNWFCGEGKDKRLVCSDTIITDCEGISDDPCLVVENLEPECNPNNPYEYLVNFTVTNNTGFDATSFILQNIPPPFSFSFCSSSSYTANIALPLFPSPLLSGNTSNSMCVKIASSVPILSPTQVCFDVGLNSPFECCHKKEQVCVTLNQCCDPCEDRGYVVDEMMEDSAECCYQIDLIEDCGYHLFTKVETEIITPGVIFGYHALGGPDASNWSVLASSPTAISWSSSLGYIPQGTTQDIIQFCLDDINDPAEVPQKVLLNWFMLDQNGNDSIACVDTLTFDCQVANNKCLAISDRSLICIPDSNKYRYTFTVSNTSSIPFTADWLDVSILSPSDLYFDPSGGIFPLIPALSVGGQQTISSCIRSTTSFPSTASDIILSYRLRFSRGDTCCYESKFDTLRLPPCDSTACLACPAGFYAGPNLIVNGDFENGNDGTFSSDHNYIAPPNVLDDGDYSVRNSSNLGNGQWAATDHTPGSATGQFLVVDGSTNINDAGWRSTVNVNVGSNYNLCFYANNLVIPSKDFSDPNIEVHINGAVVYPATLLPENPDVWVLFASTWTPTSNSATIEIFSLDGNQTGNDYAIDGISFTECIVEEPCCHDFDVFCELADASFTYDVNCDTLCFFPIVDSCLTYCLNWGDGSPIDCNTGGEICHIYTNDVPLTYYVCLDVFENTPDTTCWSKQICDSIFIKPCIPPGICTDNLALNGSFTAGLVPGQMPVPGQMGYWYSGAVYYPTVIGEDGCQADGSIELKGDQNNGQVIVQNLSLYAGNTYEISLCAKSMIDPGQGGQFAIETYSAGPYDYAGCAGPCEAVGTSPTLSNAWTNYTFTYSPPVDQHYFTIQSWNQFNDGNTLIRIDDVCVTKIDPMDPDCNCDDFKTDIGSGPKSAQNCENVKLGFSGLGECDEITVDWGDGSPNTIVLGNAIAYHTYPSFGTFTATINIVRSLADGTQCKEVRRSLTFKVDCLPHWPDSKIKDCSVHNSSFDNGAIPGKLSGSGYTDNWKTASGDPIVVQHIEIVKDTIPISSYGILLESDSEAEAGVEQELDIKMCKEYGLSIIVDRLAAQAGINEPWNAHLLEVYASTLPLDEDNCEGDDCEIIASFDIPELKDGEDPLVLTRPNYWTPARDYKYLTLRLRSADNETYRSVINDICLGEVSPCVSTDDLFTQNQMQIFPNPTEDLVYLNFATPLTQKLSLRLIDLWGRVVFIQNIDPQTSIHQLDLKATAAGVYLLEMTDDSGRAFRQKIIKH